MKWGIGCLLALVALVAVCGSDPQEVPDVVGMYPQEAIDAIHEAGIDDTESHGGIGAEESTGFAVCRTEPAAGETTDARVDIYSSRDCRAVSAAAKNDRAQWNREKRAERRAEARLARRAAERREAVREVRKERRRLREEQEQQPPPEPVDETDSAPEGTCVEVGITDFAVPSGDERDADGDGIACETS